MDGGKQSLFWLSFHDEKFTFSNGMSIKNRKKGNKAKDKCLCFLPVPSHFLNDQYMLSHETSPAKAEGLWYHGTESKLGLEHRHPDFPCFSSY